MDFFGFSTKNDEKIKHEKILKNHKRFQKNFPKQDIIKRNSLVNFKNGNCEHKLKIKKRSKSFSIVNSLNDLVKFIEEIKQKVEFLLFF